MAVPGVFHIQGAVFGTGRVAVGVMDDFLKSALIPVVVRGQGFGKVEFLLMKAAKIAKFSTKT